MTEAFQAAALDFLERNGADELRALARSIGANEDVSLADASKLMSTMQESALSGEVAAAYLAGIAAGADAEQRSSGMSVRLAWTGPVTHGVPVRTTAAALIELVNKARHELWLMTYSAKPHEPLLAALRGARAREVRIGVVVETLQGAGSALSGTEPAIAFRTVSGIELWHWPKEQRTHQGAKMHAKIAVADRSHLLVSSANLTQSGVDRNIEAGVLISGGSAPERAAEHLAALRGQGALTRL
ncbi:MAG: DISARM system phospholipase D-like protein DrmC [Mycobacterium sp.]